MELNLLHLYPALMGLYGEYANLTVLKEKLELLGVTVSLNTAAPEETPDFEAADFIYMGAGTERSQKAALAALLPHTEKLRAALNRGAVALFTGNAMELLGAGITNAAGKTWEGLSLAGFATTESAKRVPGDVIAMPSLWDAPAVGFMNKCSVTTGVESTLFPSLTLGLGNEKELGAEGYASGNLFATHLTGPVLVKNPDFLDFLVRRIFAAKGWACPDRLPEIPYQREAYEVTLKELRAPRK